MKTFILTLAVFGILTAHAQQQVVVYPGYTSYWNSSTLIPDSVVWVAKPHHKVASRWAGFHSTENRPNLSPDYRHSGYDIGHNCNASDENGDAKDEYNSFDFVNTYPQRPNCNRLTWLALENQVRGLAQQYGSVKNKVYWTGVAGHIGKDSVTVPAICVKEIWYGSVHETYKMPNHDTVTRHPYTFYRVVEVVKVDHPVKTALSSN